MIGSKPETQDLGPVLCCPGNGWEGLAFGAAQIGTITLGNLNLSTLTDFVNEYAFFTTLPKSYWCADERREREKK